MHVCIYIYIFIRTHTSIHNRTTPEIEKAIAVTELPIAG